MPGLTGIGAFWKTKYRPRHTAKGQNGAQLARMAHFQIDGNRHAANYYILTLYECSEPCFEPGSAPFAF
jgi:hypothetical protein